MGRRKLSIYASCIASCLAATPGFVVRAQSESSDPPQPDVEVLAGHSFHGEAFNEGPRQKAFLMGGTGKVSFPVTTTVAQVQELFNQGVGQLHGFWYFEAERTFRQAAVLDPECAMTYWGMAMANFENRKRAKGFIAEARERMASVNARERLWIEGYEAYLDDESGDRKKRRREYLRSLETIIHAHPDDPEAKAFLAVRLWQFKNDLPIPSYQAVDALLEQIFAVEPMHPAHHFRIHLWDREKPERALQSAALLGQASPSIAHMWHMPGHIFSRLHRYADAAWQQEASARVDHAQMMRDRVMPDQIHNFAHNNEWLIRNLIHVGRVHDAVALAKNMIELPRHPKYNTLKKRGRSAAYGRARLFQVLEQYEQADELIALCDSMYLEPTSLPEQQVVRWRALGIAHFDKGDRVPLKQQITALRNLRREQRAARKALVDQQDKSDESDDKTPDEKKDAESEDEKEKEPAETIKDIDKRLAAIKQARLELQGYMSLLEDDAEEAWEFFDEVAKLSPVRRSRLHLRAGDPDRARELALEAVEAAEGEVLPLANYAEILYRSKKLDDAKEAFGKLQAISARIDLDMPAFQRLQPLVEALNLPADWRQTPSPGADIGDRPALDQLGPFRWHPSPAAPWRLPEANGKTIALEDYRGRAVVVIFYLGAGCLHCVEQLHAFAPMTEAFAEAGISIVAVSTENERDLKRGLRTFNDKGEFPFPLVSNWLLDVFKAYRAYDDFESQPLHGTFLIDGKQHVRWQDISYEPFTNPQFMLDESKRLLRKPPSAVTVLADD